MSLLAAEEAASEDLVQSGGSYGTFDTTHLLYGFRREDVLAVHDDGVLPELGRVVVVQPVVVAGEVALLRDPELDGVVLQPDARQARGAQPGHQQRHHDHGQGVGGHLASQPGQLLL